MKRLLMIVIAETLCGCEYKNYPEVLAATRDPLFDQWIKTNKLELSGIYRGSESAVLFVKIADKEGK